MAVYFYVHYFPIHEPPVANGVIRAVHGLVSGLFTCGEKVTLLSEGAESVTVQTKFGYQHQCFANSTQRPSTHLAPELVEFIDQEVTTDDLVILNGGFHLSVYAMAKLLHKQNIPYIMAPHLTYDRQMFAKSWTRKYPYWYLCERYVLKHAQAIQILDPRQATWLTHRRITTPTITVCNGFHPTEVPKNRELDWSADVTKPAEILFFGRLCRRVKGLDLLLQGFAQITSRQLSPSTIAPLPELTLQGPEVGDRSTLATQANTLNVDQRVKFLEAEYERPAAQVMASYDIVCLPSRSEGFGLSALEAMLAGRVLLVSDQAGIAPHIKASNCGIVVEPNVEGIRDGLQQLLNCRDQWETMGKQGRQYALQQFAWPQIAQTALQLYSVFTTITPKSPVRSSSIPAWEVDTTADTASKTEQTSVLSCSTVPQKWAR